MLSVDLHAARKFRGDWSPHRQHTAVSSVSCAGISWKLESTCQDQNNVSTVFISIIYDNLYRYQPMMSPAAVDIDQSVLSCHWLKVSRGLLLLISSWKWSVQNCQKKAGERSHRSYIPHWNTSIYQYISRNVNSNVLSKNFIRFFSADSGSMINVVLCQPVITSHGLGAFISFLTVIQCFVSNTTVLMCSTNIAHLPNRKEQPRS